MEFIPADITTNARYWQFDEIWPPSAFPTAVWRTRGFWSYPEWAESVARALTERIGQPFFVGHNADGKFVVWTETCPYKEEK